MNLNGLLFFYFVTSFGSLLGMISTFIQAESTFGSLGHLALALSLRTVVSLISSINSPRLFTKFGFKNVLIASEIFGIFSLGLLFYGVNTLNFPIAVVALSILAIPSNLVSQGVISIVKLKCGNDKELFSKNSAKISKVMGLMDVAIGLSAPILLSVFSLTSIYFIDFASYILGLAILKIFSKQFETQTSSNISDEKKISHSFWFKKENLNYFKTMFGTLILIGLVPLIAGSKDFLQIYKDSIPSANYISAIWATEGIGFFLSGYIYNNDYLKKLFKPMLYVSIGFILLSVYLSSFLVLIIGCVWVTISYDVVYKSKRDEALMIAGNDKGKVLVTASSFSMMKSMFCSVSPLVIVAAINKTSITSALISILIIQSLILIISHANIGPIRFSVLKKATVIE